MTSETVTYGARKVGGLSRKPLDGWQPPRARKGSRLASCLTKMRAAGAFKKARG